MRRLIVLLLILAAVLEPARSALNRGANTTSRVAGRGGRAPRVEMRGAGAPRRSREGRDPPARAPSLRRRERGPPWAEAVDGLLAGHDAGVVVARGRVLLYARNARKLRPPASNEKLLLSMALLDILRPRARLLTRAVAQEPQRGVIRGNLWIVGAGDPSLASAPSFANPLPFHATRIAALAHEIRAAGIRRVSGDIVGDASLFRNDWNAPGWQPYVQDRFIALPSALSLDGNAGLGRGPARAAAAALEAALVRADVKVSGDARSGTAPVTATEIARARSSPLWRQLSYMNSASSNFFAEVFGKLLGARLLGQPGTIAKGARALERWARDRAVELVAHDASGLSYADRASPRALVRLLVDARRRRWGRWLPRILPRAGEGTLASRLRGLTVRAKTGTHLNGDSALSGWVRTRDGSWASFAILSHGMPKAIEDEIVRVVAGGA